MPSHMTLTGAGNGIDAWPGLSSGLVLEDDDGTRSRMLLLEDGDGTKTRVLELEDNG